MINLPHYTILISEDNLKKCKTENADLVSIIAEKDCQYTAELYQIAEIALLDVTAGDDLEQLLNDLGALVLHEDLTSGFLILEEDLAELETIAGWSGGFLYIMGEMLTIEDRKYLLDLMIRKTKKSDKVKIKCADGIFRDVIDRPTEIFTTIDDKYLIGSEEETIWWPGILNDYGDYQVYVQRKEPEEGTEGTERALPRPWGREYDGYEYIDPEDYGCPAWYRERDW